MEAGSIRGALLEEIVLYLLSQSGYRVLQLGKEIDDGTVRGTEFFLRVMGRGAEHQIDAVADYGLPVPFINPIRLLIEAKHYDNGIGIGEVRGANGALIDICQHSNSNNPPGYIRRKFSLTMCTVNGVSSVARNYAIAHDIYLLEIGRHGFLSAVDRKIKAVTADIGNHIVTPDDAGKLNVLRQYFRISCGNQPKNLRLSRMLPERSRKYLNALAVILKRSVGSAVIALGAQVVPFLMLARPSLDVWSLPEVLPFQIHFTERHNDWEIWNGNNHLFDMASPVDTLDLELELGRLPVLELFNWKARFFRRLTIQLARENDGNWETKTINLIFDMDAPPI